MNILGFRLTEIGEDMVLLTCQGVPQRMLTVEEGQEFYNVWSSFTHGMLLSNKILGGEA